MPLTTTVNESTNPVTVEQLTIGGSGLTAFAGINGGSADATGLNLTGVNFAVAIQTEKNPAQGQTAREWTAVKASATGANFVGVTGLTVTASAINVEITRKAADNTLVDYAVQNQVVQTGTVDTPSTITLDLAASLGEVTRASGNLTIDAFGFFQVSGALALSKSTGSVKLGDLPLTTTVNESTNPVTVEQLTIGGSGLTAFAGINGGSADATGLNLTGVNFAVAIQTEKNPAQGQTAREWTAVKASATGANFVGVTGLTVTASAINVEITRKAADNTLVDYAVQNQVVQTGTVDTPSTITLDLAASLGEVTRASGNLTIDAFGFFQVSGALALSKSTGSVKLGDLPLTTTVNESTNPVTVEQLTIGGSGLTAFAGINGGSADATGLNLTGVNFAVAIQTEKNPAQGQTAREWTAVKASATGANFVGVTGLTVTASAINVEITRKAADNTLVDYAVQNQVVQTGTVDTPSTITLDLAASLGEVTRASGNLTIDAFGFFQVSGALALSKSTGSVKLGDLPLTTTVNESTNPVTVEQLTIGGSGLTAFAGINGGSADATGLNLTGVNFAVAIQTEKNPAANTAAREWTAVKASATGANFVGVEGLTVTASAINVEITRKAADNTLVDYAAQNQVVQTGTVATPSTMTLDLAASLGEVTRASGNLTIDAFGFFQVSGALALSKSTGTVKLGDLPLTTTVNESTNPVTVEQLTIGGSGLTAFAGINGGSADATGLNLTGVNFAVAIQTEKNPAQGQTAREWTAVKASATGANFVGVSGLTVTASAINVEITRKAADNTLVDYAAQNQVVQTGTVDTPSTMTLDLAASLGEVTRASGNLTIDAFGFFQVSGALALSKSTGSVKLGDLPLTTTVNESTNPVTVEQLTIGGSGLTAFAGINGGSADATGLNLTGVNFAVAIQTEKNPAQGQTAREWTAVKASATGANFVGVEGLTVTASAINVEITRKAADNTLVDYAAQNQVVQTGTVDTPSTMTLDLAASLGEVTRASGNLTIDAFGFFQVSGALALSKSTGSVKLGDLPLTTTVNESTNAVTVEQLTIGGSGLTAFAGINGGSADATGLNLTGVNFAVAIQTEKNPAQGQTAREWTAVKASATGANFVGVEGLTVTASAINVEITRKAADNTLVDYAAQNQVVQTGTVDTPSTMTLDLAASLGEVTRASGNLTIDAFGFFQVSGALALSKSTGSVKLGDLPLTTTVNESTNAVTVEQLTIGGSGLTAFAGINGGSADATGLNLTGVNFAVAIQTEKNPAQGQTAREWTAVKASATGANFVGVTGLTVTASAINVEITRKAADNTLVDYAVQNQVVQTGTVDTPSTMTLDLAANLGEVTRASGNLTIDAFGFFQVSGALALSKTTGSVKLGDLASTKDVNESTNAVSVDQLTIGGSGLTAFAGINGGTSSATGLTLTGVNFALAMLTERDLAPGKTAREWTALQATAAGASFGGVDGLTLAASDMSVQINRAGTDGTLVDFAAQNLTVQTGTVDTPRSITLDLAASLGELTRASGSIELDAFGFFQVAGALQIEKSRNSVKLGDLASTKDVNESTNAVSVDQLTIGGSDLTAFAGVNGGSADATGLTLTGVNFALALLTERDLAPGKTAREWTALQATAATADFAGVDGLTLAASDMSVQLNRAGIDGTLVNFAAQNLKVQTGTVSKPSEITLNLDASLGELTRASGNIEIDAFGFFQVAGALSLEKRDGQVTLADNPNTTADESTTPVAVRQLLIGGSGLTAFAGINGGTDSEIGLDLTGAEFALALNTETLTSTQRSAGSVPREWTSLQASATTASFIGVSELEAKVDTLTLAINRAGSDGSLVDYREGTTALTVSTGTVSQPNSLSFDLDGRLGELTRASANLSLDVAGFVAVKGALAIEKSSQTVTLNDGTEDKPASQVRVEMLSVGGSGLQAFAGVAGGYDDQGELREGAQGLALGDVDFGLVLLGEQLTPAQAKANATARSWMALQASAASAQVLGLDDITVAADTLTLEINRADAKGTLVDFAARGLTVQTGTAAEPASLTLSMDGAQGELTRAKGNLTVDVMGFFQVSGGFAVEKLDSAVTLADLPGTPDTNEAKDPVAVEQLRIGASGVDAFAGVNGGQANALGLALSDVDFAIVLSTEKLSSTATTPARSWTSVQANVGDAAFVGVEGLTVAADGVTVSVNRAAYDTSVIDFRTGATVLNVATGPASELAMNLDGRRGELLQVSGHMDIDAFGFVQVEGDFALEKASQVQQITLAGGSTTEARVLTLGGHQLNAFAGVGGGTEEAIGLELGGVDFGLALYSDAADELRSWTAFQARGASANFVGVDGLQAQGTDMLLEINRAGKDGDAVIDFGLTDPADKDSERRTALTVATGPKSSMELTLEGADGEVTRAAGQLNLDVFGFFQVAGQLAIERKDSEVTLNDGVTSDDPLKAKAATVLDVDVLTFGGSGLDAFAGINGGSEERMGLALKDVNFGLALMTERLPDTSTAIAREFTTLKATAGELAFVGMDGVEASATDLMVEINRGIPGTGAARDVVVDYSGVQLEVMAGSAGQTMVLDTDGSVGELTRAAGNVKLDLFGFVSLSGNLAFESSERSVKLFGGETVATDALLVGGKGVDAFVGVGSGQADAIGLQLKNAEFGLALLTASNDASRNWTSFQATASSLSFVGIEGLTASATGISVFINQAGKTGDKVVDYSWINADNTSLGRKTALDIPTSASSTLTLSMAGSEGEIIKAAAGLDLDLFGFFSVKGNFAVEQRSQQVVLSDGSVIKQADLITIGASNVDAFAGVRAGQDDAIGLKLGQVNFGLALITDPDHPGRNFTSLQANAASAEVIGIDSLTAEVNKLLVNINQGVSLPAEQAFDTKTNTQLKLTVPAGFAGRLSFGDGVGTQNAEIGAFMTDAELLAVVGAALGSLSVVGGAANVRVTGSRDDGYSIEFMGALAGKAVNGITVAATPSATTITVTEAQAAQAGVNEVKQVRLVAVREAPAPASAKVEVQTPGQAAVNESNGLVFTTPSVGGQYNVFFVADGSVSQTQSAVAGVNELQRLTVNGSLNANPASTAEVSTVAQGSGGAVNERYSVTFTNDFGFQGFKLYMLDKPVTTATWKYANDAKDTGKTIAQLKAAYVEMFATNGRTVAASDIQVTLDASYKGTGHRYLIEFVSSLAAQDIGRTGMISEARTFNYLHLEDGSAGQAEVQNVQLKTSGTGSFTLTLVQSGKTYTTTGLNYGANAAAVRYALNAVLGKDGSVEVSSSQAGNYVVTFGGALLGKNLNPLTVALSDSQAAPSGSFTLSLGDQTSRNISYSADGVALAARVQAELARLSNVGSGNVKVSFNPAQSNTGSLGLDIEFVGSLAGKNVDSLSLSTTALANASAAVRTVQAGVSGQKQEQWVVLGNQALDKGYRLSLTHESKTYTTAVIAGNASQAQIQSAVNTAFGQISGASVTVTLGQAGTSTQNTFKLAVGGSLAGQNLNLVALQADRAGATGTSISRNFVVGNSAANITNLKSAYAELLNGHQGITVTAADIDVAYSRSTAGERYVVSFVGALAGVDINPKGIGIASTELDYDLLTNGAPAVAEVQRLSLDRAADTQGTFVLNFSHAGQTYVSQPLAFGASAADVQIALRAAVAGTATLASLGTVTVTSGGADAYLVRFGGALTGANVAALVVSAISVDAELPEGSFQVSVELDGVRTYSPAISYAADPAALRTNLQTGMDALFGAGQVTVATQTGANAREAGFTLTFGGTLAFTDVANIRSHFGSDSDAARNLSLAVVTPTNVAQGQVRTGELQRVVISSAQPQVDYTLTLTHGGSTVTTSTLRTDMAEDEVQTAITAALAGITGASASLSFYTGRELQLSFAGSLLGANVAALVATDKTVPETVTLETVETGSTVTTPAKPARTLVVDYSKDATVLTVADGDKGFALTLDGADGELMEARGVLNLNIAGFVAARGEFAIVSRSQSVTLSDGKTLAADVLTFGGNQLDAFAGVGGGYDDEGKLLAGAVGVSLDNVDLGLVIVSEKLTGLEPTGTKARSWTTAQATVDQAAFVGVEGLTIEVNDMGLEINRAAKDGTVVDYSLTASTTDAETLRNTTLKVATGPSTDLELNLDGANGQMTRLVGSLKLDVFGFVTVEGDFGIESRQGQVKLAGISDDPKTTDKDETLVNVDMLLIGGSKLNAFVGASGIGVDLQGVELGLALLTEQVAKPAAGQTAPTARNWTSVQATVDKVAFKGVEGLTVAVKDMGLSVNRMASDKSVVDYSLTESKTDAATARNTTLSVATGPASDLALTLDGAAGQMTRLVGSLELDVFGFVKVEGDFGIETRQGSVKLAGIEDDPKTTDKNETLVQVDQLLIGGSKLKAFVGAGDVGVELTDVELGLALLTEQVTGSAKPRNWTTVQASVGQAAFVGVEGLTVEVNNMALAVNRQASDKSVVDYSLTAATTDEATARNTELTVTTGPGSDLQLTLDGAAGQSTRLVGSLVLDVFGFVKVEGDFGIESRQGQVKLAGIENDPKTEKDETLVDVDMLLIGGSKLKAFAGAGDIGIELTNVELGLALLTEQVTGSAEARNWTTVQATVGKAAFVGVDGLTIEVNNMGLAVNRQASDKSVVDYSLTAATTDAATARNTELTVATGPGSDLQLTLDGAAGQTTRLVGSLVLDVFGFVKVEGDFGIESRQGQVKLAGIEDDPKTADKDETLVDVDMLLIGGSKLQAFVGAGDVGIELKDVELGLALLTEQVTGNAKPRNWTTVQATVGQVAFVGVDGLTIEVNNMGLAVNRQASDKSVVDYSLTAATDRRRHRSQHRVVSGHRPQQRFDPDAGRRGRPNDAPGRQPQARPLWLHHCGR